MKKASAIIAGILLIIIVGGLLYIKKQQTPEFDIVKTIPTDVAFYLDIRNSGEFMEQLTKESNVWKELKKIEPVDRFNEEIQLVDSIIDLDKTLKKDMGGRRAILAGKKIGKNDVNFLLAMKLENLREQKHIENLLQKYAVTKKRQVKSKVYNNIKTSYIEESNKAIITFAFVKGVLLIGNYRLIVEDAIRQTGVKTSVLDKPTFKKVEKTAGKNVTANLFINYNKLPDVFRNTVNKNYANNLDFLKNFGTWAAWDVNIKKDAILLNGFSSGESDVTELIDLFKNQEPIDQEIEEVLPANTATFLNIGISDKERYLKNYKEYLTRSDNLDKYNNRVKKINEQFGINAEKEIFGLLHEEIGIAFLNSNATTPKDNAFIIMKTKGSRFAENILGEISKNACAKTSNPKHKQKLRIDNETAYSAYKLPIPNLIGTLFGSIFNEVHNTYFTVIDNFIVFAKSTEMLQQFIYSNILNKTLLNDHQYKGFDDFLSDNINFHFYTNMYRSPQLISAYLNPGLQEGINKNLTHFRKFQAFAYQFMGNNDMIYNNLFIKYIPTVDEEPKTVWECHLDTTIDNKPAFVTNHYTGEKEIFVQDLNNKIYLINKVGRVLWEKQLDEKIISDIYQLDFYKNGKLQLFFNTKNKMHLIDRNGNYVERYPINFPSPATAGISVFDYNDNKEYRIFVPCENKRVYDYNKEGDILEGWKFDKTDTKVTSPVQHFRVNTNDYIVFADQYRVYILNRRGETRVNPEKQFTKSQNNNFILEEENSRTEPRLVTTGIDGKIYYIYFDGQVKSKKIDNYSANHYFDYQDINSDDRKDFIFLDENNLEVYEGSGKILFSRKFDTKISDPPIYFYFSYKDRKLGLVSREANEIYLFNSDGEMYDGFPLKGNTLFSIGYLDGTTNNFNLIVGNKYNFLYNYNVLSN